MEAFLSKIKSIDNEDKDIVNGYVRRIQQLLPIDNTYYIISSLVIYTILYFYHQSDEWYSGNYIPKWRDHCFEFIGKRVKIDTKGKVNAVALMDFKIPTLNLKQIVWRIKLHELYLKYDCFCVGFIDQNSLMNPPTHSEFYTCLIKVIRIDHHNWQKPYQQQDIMMKVTIDFDQQQACYQFDNDQSSALNKYVLPTQQLPEVIMLAAYVSTTAKLDVETIDLMITR